MACSKWEETGLLFDSKELEPKDAMLYEEHLKSCEDCRRELDLYAKEKQKFYTLEVLGETISPAIDQEIKRLASLPRKSITHFSLFPFIFKKTAFSVSMFVVSFVAIGYIVFHVQNASRIKGGIAVEKIAVDSSIASPVIRAQVATNDSLKLDSMENASQEYSRNRGNLDIKGVVPVDLKK